MKKISPHKLYEMSLDKHGHCDRDKYIDLMVKEGWITRKVKKDEQVEYHRRKQQAKKKQEELANLIRQTSQS